MEIIKQSKMPDGTNIQIEDWSQTYNLPYASKVAAYPIAKVSGATPFSPERGKAFRVSFDFKTADGAENCFNQLVSGKKQLLDFADVICDKNDLKYLKGVQND